MKISTVSVDEATLTVTVALDKQDLSRYVDETKTELAQGLAVEGFRKGKAPKEIADQRLNPDLVRSEALSRALEGSFSQAVQEQKWDVARTDQLKVNRNDADGLEYTLTVSLWPTVKLPDLKTISVPRRVVEIGDADIEEALETLRTMKSTFLDKTGPAAVGDRIEVDFDATINGAPVDGGSSKNHPLVIGGKNFMPGFEEALVGLSAGDSKTFTLDAPADYYEPKLAGKKVDFSVTMRRVQAVLKPAVDDAFAQSMGKFADVAGLRERIRQGATEEKEEKERQRLRLSILDAIIAKASVPAPAAMLDHEVDAMMGRFSQDLASRGMELPLYLARLKKTEQDIRSDWRPDAERQVRILLVMRQIAKDQNIAVSPEEVEASMAVAVSELARRGQASAESVDAERMRAALSERLLSDKVLSFLEATCVQ